MRPSNLAARADALSRAIKHFAGWLAAVSGAAIQVDSITIILALFALCYTVAYLASPVLPGAFGNPLGWWGWVDQGSYLKSAEAFSHLDLRSSEHVYPILYSLLAAPFIRLMPVHPFFLIDLACFLVVVLSFLTIGSQTIGLLPSAGVFLCVVCLPWVLAPAWIIPWTSTPSAAITSVILVSCSNERFAQGAAPRARYLAFGLLTGLLVLVRPLDFVVGLVGCFYLVVRSASAANVNREAIFSRRLFAVAGPLVIGTAIGPLAMAAFNINVYGSFVSPYIETVLASGYDLATIPQKFASLFNDSASLFLVHRQTFLARYPWLAITIAVIPSALAYGPNIVRLITILGIAHVALYLAYGDLLPRNLFYFGTIHYFKLWLPYFAFVGICGVLFLFQKRTTAKAAYVALTGLALAVFCCGLGFRLRSEGVLTRVIGPHSVIVQPMNTEYATLDFIDFPNIVSDQLDKYLCCDNEFIADDTRLRRLGDVHLFYGESGGRPFARAFFTSGLTFRKLVINFDESFRIPPDVAGNGVRYSFTWF